MRRKWRWRKMRGKEEERVRSSLIITVLLIIFSPMGAEFIQGVSQFSVKGEKEKKLRCKKQD